MDPIYLYPTIFVHQNSLYEAPNLYSLMEKIPARLKELASTELFGEDARLLIYAMLLHMLPSGLALASDLDDYMADKDGDGVQALLQAWRDASDVQEETEETTDAT